MYVCRYYVREIGIVYTSLSVCVKEIFYMCGVINVHSQRYMVLLKNKSDQFRSFWTIFRLRSYPIITETLHI
jgi:hypothetical protein